MTKNTIKTILFVLTLSFFVSNHVFAVTEDLTKKLTNVGKQAEFKTEEQDVDIRVYLGELIKNLLAFLGVIFLGLLVYGGFTWMRAGGDSGAVDKAKDTMKHSIVGLIIVLGAYMITFFVVQTLTSATLTN